MTVAQSDTIDFVAHDPERDEALLVMVEERAWSSSGVPFDLESKLNTYVQYVSEGRLVADFPDLRGKPVHVQLRAMHPPGEQEITLLRKVVVGHFKPADIRLSWRVIGQEAEHVI